MPILTAVDAGVAQVAEDKTGVRSRPARSVALAVVILVVVSAGWWGALRWAHRPPANAFTASDAKTGQVTFHAYRTADGKRTGYGYTNHTGQVRSLDESQVALTDAAGIRAVCNWDGSNGPWRTVAASHREVLAYGTCEFAGTPALPLTLSCQGVPVAQAVPSAGS